MKSETGTPGTETAFLSARVPPELRNAFKSLAARRGMKVQDMLRAAVEDYIEREDVQAPSAGAVVHRLRKHRSELEAAGIMHLTLFGSVARGEAMPTSDIDLAAEFAGDKPPGLIKLGKLAARIAEMLGGRAEVDLVPADKLRPSVYGSSRLDAIDVF